MILRAIVCLLLALLVALYSPAVLATKIIEMNPEELAVQATEVVRGTVIRVGSFKNDSGTKIFTETIITVEESYKGTAADEVRLVQLGGEVDGVRVTVHGALNWTQGEEVVVFLEPYQDGSFHVAGFSQGKFKIERDPSTGRAFVTRPDLPEVELVGDDGHTPSQGQVVTRVSLDQFLAQALGDDYVPRNR